MVGTNIEVGLKIAANPKLIQIGFHFGFQGPFLQSSLTPIPLLTLFIFACFLQTSFQILVGKL